MRLIDADKLMGHLMDWALHDNATEIRECMEAVKEQPTVDPVKHGRWKYNIVSGWCRIETTATAEVQCSVCGWHEKNAGNFCPNCGAKMDEEG